ncbi:Phosphatidate phosphatase PAH1 [Hibiscus syriacus]|uniref:phosphatidate phosphatase n=1 Tax=Hibiscus syriacus TaxID=106335 RepID=A0A6A2XN68_HIBSY|nr:phosphatidate phosphatase PAH1-like [Hibiscus syriacus]KAE8657867.1 Phosphatidate phosphatase PAH1 [Hibiscus syriacus]
MNVVGKVGSLISQGVYSVATPFHPFGGAVDVIVVQQQDGSFRSTPWYVRFGKFQGVLKGAEKVVHITVNGVEADFHMFLDNSGEAYFAREVDPCKGIETDGDLKDSDGEGNTKIGEFYRLEHSVSDSAVLQLRNGLDSRNPKRFERAESDTRYYDFQDEQSMEGSVNLSEYGSGRYEGLNGECFGEAQGSDSEVVLVSVDGHILTAPVSASEQSAENVQLSTPQFHLGPGEEPDFCEDNEEFSSGDNVWASDYISKLNSVAAKEPSDNICILNSDSTALNHPEVCENGVEHACQIEETPSLSNHVHESEMNKQSEVEDASMRNKDDIFKSCLELTELGKHGEDFNSEDIINPLEAQISQDKPPCRLPDDDETEEGAVGDSRNKDVLSSFCRHNSSQNNGSPDFLVDGELVEKEVLATNHTGFNNASVGSVSNDLEQKDEQYGTSAATKGLNSSEQSPTPEDKSSKSEIVETETSGEEVETRASSGFEISICGNELHAGMGQDAAAEVFEAYRISHEEYKNNAMSIIKNANLIVRFGERYFLWEKAAPIVLGMAAFGLEFDVDPQDAIRVEQNESSNPENDDSTVTSTSSGRRWRLWPIPFRRVKALEQNHSNLSTEEEFVDTESTLQDSPAGTPASSGRIESPRKQFIRTNVPTSEQIASLNLKDGQNKITFSFSTRVLGTQQVDAHIYLWKWNAKIVISDVDGTITKSDVLGQFMPLVGRDWTQSGVAKLFSAIKENGYQLLFLSARAIVQAYLTRSFLNNLKQDGKALPNGPVVISPDGLFPSLYREVIRRAPHEFKIACLEDIKKLFPSDYNPFYAGFGNRDTDELSYRKIGIPKGKIFIINPKGEVAISHCIDVKSYTSLHTLVNDMFPPTSLVEQEDFNSWNFWKVPLPNIE